MQINKCSADKALVNTSDVGYDDISDLMHLWLTDFVDGLSDSDRKEYSTFNLDDIAVQNQKDLRYSLSKHAFSEVKHDWPHYTEQEKEAVKK